MKAEKKSNNNFLPRYSYFQSSVLLYTAILVELFLSSRWLPFPFFTLVIPNLTSLLQVPLAFLLTFNIKFNSQTSKRKQNSSGLCTLAFLPPFLQPHPVYLPWTTESRNISQFLLMANPYSIFYCLPLYIQGYTREWSISNSHQSCLHSLGSFLPPPTKC